MQKFSKVLDFLRFPCDFPYVSLGLLASPDDVDEDRTEKFSVFETRFAKLGRFIKLLKEKDDRKNDDDERKKKTKPKSSERGRQHSDILRDDDSWIDVTVALRHMVERSQLELHDGVSYSSLLGFCDVDPLEKKHLKIRYRYRRALHETCVPQDVGIHLPYDGHRIADSFQTTEEVERISTETAISEEEGEGEDKEEEGDV